MDVAQDNGLAPVVCAEKIIKSIERGKTRYSSVGKALVVFLSSLLPHF
jgi:hypothetical protein